MYDKSHSSLRNVNALFVYTRHSYILNL